MTGTIGRRRSGNALDRGRGSRTAGVLVCAAVALLASVTSAAAQTAAKTGAQRTFASAEDAVQALADAVKKDDLDALRAIFGPEGRDLVASSDPATARQSRQVFAVAAREQWHLEDALHGRKTLVVGNEQWPFPVPLVKEADAWRFDIGAGKEEVLARRIGRNELQALATCRAYVTAQRRYAQESHDGTPAGLHAAKFQSDAGKQNGLYWPAARGQKRSPLGDLVAQAAEEGRPLGGEQPQRTPFHGYFFKILTGQGALAPGGAKSYLVKGQMSGGFALVAWPAQYDSTGVMTFVVNQDGIVRERDLGPQTDAIARKMTAYNPGASWRQVP
jgi:hypothetical protein